MRAESGQRKCRDCIGIFIQAFAQCARCIFICVFCTALRLTFCFIVDSVFEYIIESLVRERKVGRTNYRVYMVCRHRVHRNERAGFVLALASGSRPQWHSGTVSNLFGTLLLTVVRTHARRRIAFVRSVAAKKKIEDTRYKIHDTNQPERFPMKSLKMLQPN